MKNRTFLIFCLLLVFSCNPPDSEISGDGDWEISVLPSSVRLDPSTNTIIEHRFDGVDSYRPVQEHLLKQNWVYDGEKVNLYGARGEYISFQLVLIKNSSSTLKGIQVEAEKFASNTHQFSMAPELFLEWAVEVKTPSTGYPKASLGKGWYPDALIPYPNIQADSSTVRWRWVYPLELPDFNNRIDHQQSAIFWIDQYIPLDPDLAPAGSYTYYRNR